MRHASKTFSAETLGVYAFVWTFGNILGLLFWTLVMIGFIRIRGYRNAVHTVSGGNVIIAANHPSLLETFLIPALFYPRYLFDLRYFVWSMPDRNLFLPWLRWVYPFIRCITVDRSKRMKSARGAATAIEVLRRGGVVVMHPEGGRTIRGTSFVSFGGRRMRRIISAVPRVAHGAGAKILPLWIHMRGVDRPLRFDQSIGRMFLAKYRPIILSFGSRPYRVRSPLDQRAENERLQQKILSS